MPHREHYYVLIKVAILTTLIITSSCASSLASMTPTSEITNLTPSSPSSTATSLNLTTTPNPSDRVNVGGYTLRYKCSGQGTPTVIVEAGLGDAPIISRSWLKVTKEIQKTTRICIYDRAGIGTSDKAPTPRTSKDMAQDLHKLLINAHIGGPYILAAHSIGGLIARVYASQYPDEVVGMVLVDSSVPDQFSKFMAVLPPETSDEPISVKNLRRIINASPNNEGMDIAISAAQVRAANPLGYKPLVVITHSPTWSLSQTPAVDDITLEIEHIWQDLQVDLLSISSNSTHIIAGKAGHNIQIDEPQLVIDAIIKVLNEVQNK